ncbi:hypothetical protein TRFO_30644 [Tritrichomonas foetus]|uniref:Uncharacterized protein n=1 Tax=Tritrichomonas foetus TaxID=1144522 RepID=A0A1J4JYC6_9EUKA|nr:hypothetical protein TRFO_30644 [Tritrichomonas foetus]|eukprot:OHT02277.1 hypothetical protein TRFO_30644 [Tritrichomonas foetus]
MTTSPTSGNKIKAYSTITCSSLMEMRDLLSRLDIPQIIDNERSTAIQTALDAQAEEIEILRKENQILSLSQQNQNSGFSKEIFKKFYSRFELFIDHFCHEEFEKMQKIKLVIDNCHQNIQNFNNVKSSEYQKEISNLQNEILLLRSQSEKNNNHTEMIQQINDLTSKLSKQTNEYNENMKIMKKAIEEKDSVINKMTTEMLSAKSYIEQLENQNKTNEDLLKEKNHQITLSLQNLGESDNKNNAFYEDIINKMKNESKKNEENYQNEINRIKQQLEERQNEFEKAEIQFQSSLNEKEEQLKNLLDSQNNLINQINKKQAEIIELKKQPAQNDQTQKLQDQILEYEKQIQTKEDLINSINDQAESKENQLKLKEIQISTLQRQLETSLSQDKDVQIQKLMDQTVQLNKEKNTLLTQNIDLKEEISNLKISCKKLEESKSLLSDANLQLNTRIEELEESLSTTHNSENLGDDNQITKLKDSIEQTRIKHAQQVKLLTEQIKSTIQTSDFVKEQYSKAQSENIELEKKLINATSSLNTLKISYSMAEHKIKSLEELNTHQETIIQKLTQSKEDVNSQYNELFQTYQDKNSQLERLNRIHTQFFNCEPSEVTNKLHELMEKISDLQHQSLSNSDLKREITLLRKNNSELQAQIQKKDEQLRSTLKKINLCREGKESEIVQQFRDDFSVLHSEYSKLIYEHQELKGKLFASENSFKEIQSKLIDQEKSYDELVKKTEKFDLYEFITQGLIDFLSSLSSNLISSLIHSSIIQERLTSVDSLLVQLNKKHFSHIQIEKPWSSFCQKIYTSMMFDPVSSVETHSQKLIEIIEYNLTIINQKTEKNESKMNSIIEKLPQTIEPRHQSSTKTRQSLYERSLKSDVKGNGHYATPSFKIKNNNPFARNAPSTTREPKSKNVD